MSNELVRVAAISPDPTILQGIADAFANNPQVGTLWTVDRYPDRDQLADLLTTEGPWIIFLDFSNKVLARPVAAELDARGETVAAIAIYSTKEREDLLELMQFGIREVLPLPVDRTEVVRIFARTVRKLRSHQAGANLYAFLPVRAGAGATTLAAHSAAAAARISGHRTLLLDFDFRLGMTSFLFKLHSGYSVTDAIFAAGDLDAGLDRLISRRDSLEILGSAPIEYGGMNPEAGAVHLLDQLKEKYEVICVDLPGEMRDYEIETLHRAAECFLVTTADIGALHMAKRKVDLLQTLGLRPKISVVLNRFDSASAISAADVEEMLQLPVRFTVPAANKEIAKATQNGETLTGRSALMTQIERIARRMAPGATTEVSMGHRFLEAFSVTPVRERFRQARASGGWWKL